MEETFDPGQVILYEIASLEVQRAQIEARVSAKMLEFTELRRREADADTAVDPRVRDLQAGFAADELAIALHVPTRVVQCRAAEARRVRNLMPLAWAAHLGGTIDAYRVSLIASALAKLTDNHQIIELDYVIVDYAASHTTAQLKGKLKRFVAANVPAAQVVKTEMEQRSVWVEHGEHGMSFLHAYLPTVDVVAIDGQITAHAKAMAADARSFDAKRADALRAQLAGSIDGQRSSRAVIGITVPVTSLAGWDDQPGISFDRSYALPAELVRDLAGQPGTWWFRILTDPLGQVLDTTEPRPFPSDALRTAVQARDGTCRFATCSRPAMDCDLDHQIPRPSGPTRGDNLRPLCRRHHNMKTHNIAEPTDLRLQTRRPSLPEHQLARALVDFHHAA